MQCPTNLTYPQWPSVYLPGRDYLVSVLERYSWLIPKYAREHILAVFDAKNLREVNRWGLGTKAFWLKDHMDRTIRFSWTTPDDPVMVSFPPTERPHQGLNFRLPRVRKVEISAE